MLRRMTQLKLKQMLTFALLIMGLIGVGGSAIPNTFAADATKGALIFSSESLVWLSDPSVWELYKWRVIGAVSLIVLQSILIVWLLLVRAKRKQAEAKSARYAFIAEGEHRRLEEIVANVQGIVWESRIDPATGQRRTTFISSYAEKMLGYPIEQWMSTSGFGLSLMPEEDREKASRVSEAVIATGKEGVSQFRWITKDQRVLWIESYLAPIIDETGKTVGLRGVSVDITDRKEAEEAVRESESRFQNVADTAPVLIWVTGTDKLCTYVNQQWLEFTGRTMDQELGNGWAEGVHPDDYERCLQTYLSVFDQRQLFKMEYRLRRADGEFRWIYDIGTPLFSPNHKFLGYIGSCVDITDRKDAEAALHTLLGEVSELKNKLQEENIYLQEEIKLHKNFGEIIGLSDALKYVLFKIEQVAPTDTTVLITGETGTGKELVASAIHNASSRCDRPMVKVNCAALSPTLIESEFFGHEKGAFTGALARKIGRFELANGTTIFLDEIGELPLELQVKLLRVIQEGELERLGGYKTIKVDVRIIAATNRSLEEDVKQGRFRGDLWYRLNVFPITVPPLRQRREDIVPLCEHFVRMFSSKMGKGITSIAPATLNILRDHSWPGNVRELANVIERAVINSHGSVLRIVEEFENLETQLEHSADKTLEEMERDYILQILEDRAWRIDGRQGAARILGMNPSTLRTRMAKLGIKKNVVAFRKTAAN